MFTLPALKIQQHMEEKIWERWNEFTKASEYNTNIKPFAFEH